MAKGNIYDPLGKLGRNDLCWCDSDQKYKSCHGNKRPDSQPGAPLPADPEDGTYISPRTVLATDALSGAAGAPLTMPAAEPTVKPIVYTNWDQDLVAIASTLASPMQPGDLGRLRVEVLRRLAALPNDESAPTDDIKEGIFRLAAESLRTVAALAAAAPKPSVFWNEELDPAAFMGRTLLLADHVAIPDDIFQEILQSSSNRSLRRSAEMQLASEELLIAGLVIPVPRGVAMAVSGSAAAAITDLDLKDASLVSWVRDQLILEGPTAREALLVRAADDLSMACEKFWLHARIEPSTLKDDGTFTTRMLEPYDNTFDYGPWIKQVSDSAVSYYVQRTNERIVAADVYGAEYVSSSMFEARLLRRNRRGQESGAAQAAVWADIPQLPALSGRELAKLIQHEDAVEDLRRQVRASLASARTPGERTDAITDLSYELEAASHQLEKTARSNMIWQAALPGGLGAASLVLGSVSGGLLPIAAGAIGTASGLVQYVGTRISARREAAYLFVRAGRSRR